jgi:8-oxo-dGTP pyrophosphatase MutT (NUDIX family)
MAHPTRNLIHLTLRAYDDGVILNIDPELPTPSAYPRAGGILRTYSDSTWRYAAIHGRASDKWGFPKGRRRSTESELGCALREVQEEIGWRDLHYPVKRLECDKYNSTYYLFDVPSTMPLQPHDICEIKDARWVTLKELDNLPHIKVVNTMIRHLKCLE